MLGPPVVSLIACKPNHHNTLIDIDMLVLSVFCTPAISRPVFMFNTFGSTWQGYLISSSQYLYQRRSQAHNLHTLETSQLQALIFKAVLSTHWDGRITNLERESERAHDER